MYSAGVGTAALFFCFLTYIQNEVNFAIGTVMIATVAYGVFATLFLFDSSPTMVIVTGVLLGIPVSGFMVLLKVLLAQIIDYDEVQTGKRREGMYLGMNGFIVRIGMSLQYAIMGVFFATSEYHAELAEQTRSTIFGFRFLIGWLPLLVLMISFFLLWKYKQLNQNQTTSMLPHQSM